MLYWGRVYKQEGNLLMPLYEYHCNDCGEAFEKVVRFSEAETMTACPNCGSADTSKMISTIASFGTSESNTAYSSNSSCGSGGRFT